jgi:DNA mismatch repair protein MutS
MARSKDVTPIRKQYLEIKRQYPDTILFFRLGDFYETFDQDAETTSRELDIVLTSRNVAKGVRIPMAGIPYHAVENYLARLIDRGYHVAICDQVGDQPVKGLVPRKVTRVVTPGTVVEPGLLPGDANNYLACIVWQDERAGVAYVDITTGEFSSTEILASDIEAAVRAEMMRLQPAEILHTETAQIENEMPGYTTPWPAWRFESARCQQVLLDHFETASLDGFGLRGMPLAISAAGGHPPHSSQITHWPGNVSIKRVYDPRCSHTSQSGDNRNHPGWGENRRFVGSSGAHGYSDGQSNDLPVVEQAIVGFGTDPPTARRGGLFCE